jgi:hypothetical protein
MQHKRLCLEALEALEAQVLALRYDTPNKRESVSASRPNFIETTTEKIRKVFEET